MKWLRYGNNTGRYVDTCRIKCPCVGGDGLGSAGIWCDGNGSSGGCCLWVIGAFCGLGKYGGCWYLLLLHCGGPEMSVLVLYCWAGTVSVGNNGVFLAGCGCGCTGVGFLHWSAVVSLVFVTFEGLGGGIGHVLVGGIVTVCSMSVGNEVISSSEVLSTCDCSSSIVVSECLCNSMEQTVKCYGV